MRTLRLSLYLSIASLLAFQATLSRVVFGAGSPSADSAASAPHPAAQGDALLEALLTELDRSKAQLKMDQLQAPYYVEYRVNDLDDFLAEAAFGAVREQQRLRVRILRVVVRIGDYKQDSYY